MIRNTTHEARAAGAASRPISTPTLGHAATRARLFGPMLLGLALAANTAGGTASTHASQAAVSSTTVAATMPANGDQNPYGIAIVPRTMGALTQGDVLVSNFNNGKNLAGLGTTIVQISPNGSHRRVFAQINAQQLPGSCPGGVGLTTALTILRRGYVIVGSLPTTDGTPTTAKAGCLLVLDADGRVISTITAPDINGPWDMTALDQGKSVTLFVSNVLNGTAPTSRRIVNDGTVVRLVLHVPAQGIPQVLSNTVVGSGFAEKLDDAALALGPTGLGLGTDGTLYVADNLENRIAAIPNALTRADSAYTGLDLTAGDALNGPLGLAMAPNGDILSVNAGDGKLVETDIAGTQVLSSTISMSGTPPGVGALFGLAVAQNGDIFFGDDNAITLDRWAGSGVTREGVATLLAQKNSGVNGAVFLVQDAQPGLVDVFMHITGLLPNSVHPTHIHQGTSCASMGPVLYPLPDLRADSTGAVTTQTTIHAASIPAPGWYINIHQGMGSDTSLSCGLVQLPM